MSNSKFNLIYAFKNQNPDFVYGFQAGEIWQLFKTDEPFEYTFLGKIKEEVEGMIAETGITNYEIQVLGYDWYKIIVKNSIEIQQPPAP